MSAARCKTCGTPLDQIPFEPCPEHAKHDRLQQALQNVADGLDAEKMRQQELDYYYGDEEW